LTEALLFLALLLGLVFDLSLVAAYAAFSQTNHARLLTLRERAGPRLARTTQVLGVYYRLKATLNLASSLTRFCLAGLVLGIVWNGFSQNLAVMALILFLWLLLLSWLEWGAEQAAAQNPEDWALRTTPLVGALMTVLWVFVALPLAFTRPDETGIEIGVTVTEDELKTLVDAGQEEGVLEQGERRMIYSIFQLGETLVREIMVPRIDMLALDVQTPLGEAIEAISSSGHSRIPVFDETADHMLGILYAKDLLKFWKEDTHLSSLRNLIRPVYFVPEAKRVDSLLAEMQTQRIHIAIVVDEYGGVAGLVTLEDIVEEILGEIQDEYDQGEESPYQELPDGYLFQGKIALEDFNEIMGSDLTTDEADTLGGYIYGLLGRVPNVGEEIGVGRLVLTVDQVTARRIRKVRAQWVAEQENGKQEEGNDDDA
jgi:CBS domain containing-hemolysin-like protein